jgi:hypothetical protein
LAGQLLVICPAFQISPEQQESLIPWFLQPTLHTPTENSALDQTSLNLTLLNPYNPPSSFQSRKMVGASFVYFKTTTSSFHLANMIQAATGLPPGWEIRHSNSKNLPYYFHEAQKQSSWEPPQGTDTEKLKTYMAANHSASQISPDAAHTNGNANAGKIRASHLLVKHKDSRRPSSWKQVRLTFYNSRVAMRNSIK